MQTTPELTTVIKPRHAAITALPEEECRALLKENVFGHLGCHSGKEVYVLPISYVYEDGYIYGHSRAGKKVAMMRKKPQVCLQVEDVQDHFHWKSVIAWGKYEELKGDEAAAAMRRLMNEFSRRDDGPRMSSLVTNLAAELDHAIVYRIKLSRITGRGES